jgi:hypothetical protein
MIRKSFCRDSDEILEACQTEHRRETLISNGKRSMSIGGVDHYIQLHALQHQPGFGPPGSLEPIRRSPSMESASQKLLSGPPKFTEYTVNYDLHVQNRRKLVERFRDLWETNTVLLFEGGKTTYQYDSDTERLFRQESNFQYDCCPAFMSLLFFIIIILLSIL